MRAYFNEKHIKSAKNSDKVIFLDRDGVINRRMPPHRHILKWDDFVVLPSVYEALHICNEEGFPIIVVTNQRCISLGTLSEEEFLHMCEKIVEDFRTNHVEIDGIYYCPHGNDDHCGCRKPRTGLLEQAEADFSAMGIDIDRSSSWLVGDEDYDIEAGKRFSLNTVLIDKLLSDIDELGLCENKYMARDLLEAVKLIISNEGERTV